MSFSRGDPVSSNELKFISSAICESQLRMDGRGVYDFRTLKITFGSEYGQVQVQLGTTRVYVVTTCEVTAPQPDKPSDGFFTFNVHFSPISSLEYENARTTPSGVELGRIVERGLRQSRAVDTEALCIVSGEKVWSIRVDIRILDDNGNLTDCCSIGAITALQHFRRPDITIGPVITIHPAWERELVPLSIHHMPLCVTMGIFKNNTGEHILVVDPTWKEEQVMEGKIVIIMNIHKELCGIQKSGGIPVPPHQIVKCTRIALVKVQELTEIIKTAIEEDVKKKRQTKRLKSDVTIIDESSAFSAGGIGASESLLKSDSDSKFQFHHDSKAVSIGQESIEKSVTPAFNDKDVEQDFAEFAKYFKSAKQSVFEDMEAEEEEEEEEVKEDHDMEAEKEKSASEEKEESGEEDMDSEDESEEEGALTLVDEFSVKKEDSFMETEATPEPESKKTSSSEDACGW
eukprot:TRINITY_DN573_c0_g1_i1.p1 TRINITY_DN573_c0_g1~~TRINITY_DN573_c0_g1_i1.p1  ORF type:complete len:459 (+),score=113.42 TRINITY_DN573_c0_g1_i1:3-1379(+)